MRVDEGGVHLDRGLTGSCDVYFDDQHVWSFDTDAARSGLVAWPARMVRKLDGLATVRVEREGKELFAGEVAFGRSGERVRFVDSNGLPVMVDKWGLLQRPFSGRGEGVVADMVARTEQILAVLEACGVPAWIAFGTLLGAARTGGVIGHDSDIDLAYLSSRRTPAEMTRELYDVARALRAAGLQVVHKSGSFITVVFPSPDGAEASIDIYVCFHVGDLLYETATVRAPVPRSAILPLGTIEFEGRMLPAPADVDRLLTVSYGPGWRVPDPSFRHTPGPEIVRRFDGWFANVMRNRRDWEGGLVASRRDPSHGASEFATWVADRLEGPTRVIEIGTGTGVDALALGRRGHTVLGLDYARRGMSRSVRRARRGRLAVSYAPLNLYDGRDVLTRGALVTRGRPPRQAVYARDLLTTLEPDGADNFWRFTAMALAGGGAAYLEDRVLTREDVARPRGAGAGGKLRVVTPESIAARVGAAGGTVLETSQADERWRLVASWGRR